MHVYVNIYIHINEYNWKYINICVCVYSASRMVPREEHTSICYHWKIAKQAWEKYPPPAIKRSIGKSDIPVNDVTLFLKQGFSVEPACRTLPQITNSWIQIIFYPQLLLIIKVNCYKYIPILDGQLPIVHV